MAASAVPAKWGTGFEVGAERHQLQCWDQRLRERGELAAGAVAVLGDGGCEVAACLTYSAGISVCEKGGLWQQALALLREIGDRRLAPDVISYSAGISACEKARQWQRAVSLLREMRGARLEPNVISQLQLRDQRVREGRAVAAGAGAAPRDAGRAAGAQRHLQAPPRVQTGAPAPEPPSGSWAARRGAGVSRGTPSLTYSAAISACEKGGLWGTG
ncbi:unnamed protein product [Prorocentrum cordatum]|uniref:Pentatricopeptide repeat-containing protein, chloroplastic n=1 Tax=Prorocentrum cordatum TaxID=2364126 RepID=A0ABN9THP1_9DINO|nr:unnamed protein product [Polarella glacialis]